MLGEALELMESGYTCIISLVRTPEKLQLSQEINNVPFDLDYLLTEHPDFVLIDDIACTNTPSSSNKYRWQDVQDLLAAGIDVFATMHVGNLMSVSDRVSQILSVEPEHLVPDLVFYSCDQLEFVDIDPKELIERHKNLGIYGPSSPDLSQLKELRALALHCVSEYASRSSRKEAKRRLLRSLDEKVLALIYLDGADELVIHEAARIAEALDAPLKVLLVDRSPDNLLSSHEKKKKETALSSLHELTEKLSGEFIVLKGEDSLSIAADYIQAQAVTDVVLSRAPLSAARRMLLPLVLPRADKIAALLPTVHIHSVPQLLKVKKYHLRAPILRQAVLNLRFKDLVFTLLTVAVATIIVQLLSSVGFSSQTSVLLYVLGAALVARFSQGYLPGVIASLLSIATMSYFFVRPYYSFSVEHKAHYVTFLVMIVVSLIITTLASRMQRDSQRARLREQHTQVLYELNKNLLHTRGIQDVVSTSLETITRLFDRAAVMYLKDPFIEGSAKVRPATGDMDVALFSSSLEKEAAKKALEKQLETGADSDIMSMASAHYIPISAGEDSKSCLAVLGISTRKAPLSEDDKTFISMISNQIALAFERQIFIDEHRYDLQKAELNAIKTRFAEEIIKHASLSSRYANELSRKLIALKLDSSNLHDAQAEEEQVQDTCSQLALAAVQRQDEDVKLQLQSAQEQAEPSCPTVELLSHLIAAESQREHRFTEALSLVLTPSLANYESVELAYLLKAAQEKLKGAQHERQSSCPCLIKLDLSGIESKALVEKRLFINSLVLLMKHLSGLLMHAEDKKVLQVSLRQNPKGKIISFATDSGEEELELLNLIFSDSYLHKREQAIFKAPSLKRLDRKLSAQDELDLILATAGLRAHGAKLRARKRLGGGLIVTIQLHE